jgi:hypothetical protein
MNDIKRNSILSLVLIFFCISIYSQDTLNERYFSKLIDNITKTTDIKDYKLIIKRFHNNHIKEQRLIVKYNSDSIDRYWRIGQYFAYYRNGNIKISEKIDPYKRIRTDTAYNFYKKGKIKYIIIWNNENTSAPLIIGPWLPGNYWTIDPVRYKKIEYSRNGNKFCEQSRVFSDGNYVLDGDKIFYQRNAKY